MLRYLLEKEFKRIRRDRFLPRIIFVVPILQLLILPFAANFEMKNINLSVVDNDHSPLSERLIEKIYSSGYFIAGGSARNYDEALSAVEDNRSDLILEIPSRFEKESMCEGNVPVLIAANAVNGTKGGIGISYLLSILDDFNREEQREVTLSAPSLSSVEVSYLFNPHLNYKAYMVPAIMAFLITIIGGFLPTLNIVSEKEKGTIEQINVTPIPKVLFMLSKIIPFWVIGFILLTISVLVGWLVYGLWPVGHLWVVYLFAAVYLFAFTGFGLTVSNISSNQQQAMFTTFFFMINFILLSGLFTPVSSMPEWVQKLTLVNPLRYLIEVIRFVYLKGSTFADLLGHFVVVVLFAVFSYILAVVTYRKSS